MLVSTLCIDMPHIKKYYFDKGGSSVMQRIVFFSYPRLTALTKDVLNDETIQKIYIIERSFSDLHAEASDIIDKELADVFVSAGSNSEILKKEFPNMPLISIKVKGYDLMESIVEASIFGSNIAVVTFQNQISEIEKLKKILTINIEQYVFHNKGELYKIMEELKNKGIDAVIGSSIVCDYAENNDLNSVFIYSGNSVKEAFEKSIEFQESLMIEKRRTNEFKAIIDFAYSGIIAIDDNKKINVFNPIAEKITGLSSKEVLGKNIDEVIENTRLSRVLDSGKRECNQLQKLRDNVIVNTNRIPIIVDNKTVGAVATFQDISEIQNAERNIRMTLYKKGLVAKYTFNDIIGRSESLDSARRLAQTFAGEDDVTILITGETGTGKELFAHSIHNFSKRSDKPFVAINCAALPENLLESELFGYEEGAFTGAKKGGKPGLIETANEGTLLLDEISEMSTRLQARFLRVLQEKEVLRIGGEKITPVNARIIAATNRDLFEEVKKTNFREDLYYRLNVVNIKVPSLEERKDDIPLLVQKYLEENFPELINQYNTTTKRISEKLSKLYWPGNIRQLYNTVHRIAIILKNNKTNDFSTEEILTKVLDDSNHGGKPVQSYQYNERDIIIEKLNEMSWDRTRAAKSLGMSRTTLWRKMKELGVK